MPIAAINDASLYYEVHGQGPALVCISGYSSDYSIWLGFVESLSKQFQVILFSNRGVGQSTAPDSPFTIEELGEDAIGLLDHLNIKQAHFWGSSMGGAAIQTLCYRHPKRVLSAVLGNTFASFDHIDSRWRLHNSATFQMPYDPAHLLAYVQNRMAWVFSDRYLNQPEHVQKVVDFAMKNPHPPSLNILKAQWAALQKFDSRAHLSQIKAPCLVIGSDDDLLVPRRSFDFLIQNIPEAQSHWFQDVGHVAIFEAPKEYLRVLQNFYSNCFFKNHS